MTSYTESIPRNIKFQQQNLFQLREETPFLHLTHTPFNTQQKYHIDNKIMARTQNYLKFQVKGFDSYFKNNLLLRACNAEDIQYVRNNPLVFQEDVHIVSPSPKKSKTMQKTQPKQAIKSNTAKNFYQPQINDNQNINMKKSKQAQLNEFLFNYRKQQEQKKTKKMKFLSDIEQRINNLQKQAQQLQAEKGLQYEELNEILKIQNDVTDIANKATLVGKLNLAIHQSDLQNKRCLSPPKKITQEMEIIQINAAIDEQHNYNDALLDQVERVSRSKSKQRVKDIGNAKSILSIGKSSLKPQSSSMSKTIKKFMQVPPRPSSSKKMIKTWRGKNKI